MIRYLIMDVDGTLTDGKIYMSSTGEAVKAFNIKDGCGINNILIPAGIIPLVITGRESQIVLNRCKEVGITEIYQGVSNKVEKIHELIIDLSSVAYIGDDINDIEAMNEVKRAGCVIGCPSDAVPEVKEISSFIANNRGGDGAVREFIEWITKSLD